MSELYRLIHTEKANYPILLLCRVLHVARSSYYAWREGEAARRARQAADDALAHEITVLHIASRKTYGVPRVHAELRRLGRRVNRKRVARVMRERDIRGVTRRKHRSLTRPDAKAKPAPDLIGRDFHAERPGIKLVGDITCLPTAEGWLYLACRLDLATREVVGYAMRPPSRRTRHRHPRHGSRPGAFGARLCHTQRSRQRVHIGPIPRPDTSVGAAPELRTHRITLRQCRRAELLGSAQGGDRNPDLARPDHRPRQGPHLHRDLLKPPPPAQTQDLRLSHPGRDQAAPPTRSRGITNECPRARGNFRLVVTQ